LSWFRERNEALRDLSLFTFFTAFAIIPIIITTRYRLPIYPILAIFAAYVVMRAYRDFKGTIPFIFGGTAIVLGIAVIDLVQFSEKIFGRIRTMLS
ncbi:MAG: hypothetical protein NUW08_02845, partial [Candidatus Uhrbacteria bacterium]|nr:hypothetical protein [Candidatus Uhrbacteria bacterium]